MNDGSRPRKAGPDSITAIQSNRPTVVELRSRSLDRVQERALAAVRRHLREAREAIDAVLTAGDVDAVFLAHREINRAMGVTLDNRLRTIWPNGPTCPTCGAEVSAGRCWGCGTPPERAS